MLTGVFNFIAGFVGEFAEIHLVAVGGKAQHRDVCSRAEYPIALRSQNDCPNFRMLKTKPLNRIMKFNVDTKIIGVEFQCVSGMKPCIRVHCQLEKCDSILNF